MHTATRVIANTYRDSVSLMQLSASLTEAKGVEQASIVMATPANLDLLREAGLLDGAVDARASDVLVLVRAQSSAAANDALERAAAMLRAQPASGGGAGGPAAIASRSITMALKRAPAANLALISVPGEYAAAEAQKALGADLNVLLFSDNVSVDDEVALKRKAGERGLLLMGPDCGTAILDGVPLGFANSVRRGSIGCIGASGTGLQQVTALIDRFGQGVSQAIGTGGRDLSEAVGGATTLAALSRLAKDRDTKVIVLIGKPPHPGVAQKVLGAAAKARKPVVVNFIGTNSGTIKGSSLHGAHTLEDAARAAVALADGKRGRLSSRPGTMKLPSLPRFVPSQRFVRGLYSGGTFCYEASLLLGEALAPDRYGHVWSNASVTAEGTLADPWKSREHTVVDLGDDVFTRGRPHPMIDHRMRNERIVAEAGDDSVAVILLDVVLGHGSHPDPASAMVPAIRAAQVRAKKARRALVFVGFVCGTTSDPQRLDCQQAALRDAGVHLAPTNAHAVRLAAAIARRAAGGAPSTAKRAASRNKGHKR
jgi:succinyl-CoA synthetase alpha subunit